MCSYVHTDRHTLSLVPVQQAAQGEERLLMADVTVAGWVAI